MNNFRKVAKICCLWLAVITISSVSHAKETYDTAAGILTIPYLIASDGTGMTESIIANNLKITLGDIKSYDRSYSKDLFTVPSHTAYYDLITGELNLPFVTADGIADGYENVVATVGSVVDIGGSENILAGDASFQFTPFLDKSLPLVWKEEFAIVLSTLEKDVPIFAKKSSFGMGVFAWNNDVAPPHSFLGAGEACVCGNGYNTWMSLAIPNAEFEWGSMHRYSVIPHEYFHVFQTNLAPDFNIKWLMEGGAATIESLYVQENYDYSYFANDQAPNLDSAVVVSPEFYESYDTSNTIDNNYSGSVFITLVLIEELKKTGLSEVESLTKVLSEFYQDGPVQKNWKTSFELVFGFSVETFYTALKSYEASYESLIPSATVKLSDIF